MLPQVLRPVLRREAYRFDRLRIGRIDGEPAGKVRCADCGAAREGAAQDGRRKRRPGIRLRGDESPGWKAERTNQSCYRVRDCVIVCRQYPHQSILLLPALLVEQKFQSRRLLTVPEVCRPLPV
jgi:hypothetical protein